jgi:hypothetical protein
LSNSRKRIVSDNYAEFLLDIKNAGVDIGFDKTELLKERGFIVENESKFASTEKEEKKAAKSALEQAIQNYKYKKEFRKGITSQDWKPASKTEHEPDFIRWIDSINSGFQNMVKYEKFDLFCEQADEWLSQPTLEDRDIDEWEQNEIKRCHENTYYFIEKYLYVKDSEEESGRGSFKYNSTKAHKVLIYLYDCGYNIFFTKPRQVAATTTFQACALKSLVFQRNKYIKFITQDEKKGIEIFEDKVKYPHTELPEFMRPEVKNFSAKMLGFGYGKKGEKEGANTRMEVVPPSETAISGGSPSEILIDEAGNIGLLTKIIENGMPTLFRKDMVTGKIKMLRRFIAWGTGGDMEKGGQAFQTEFMSIYKKWQDRDFRPCIIPVFFDWTTRPGIDQAFYDSMKDLFYSKEGPEREASRIEFHQQYPSTLEEVFMSSAKTLVDMEYINKQLKRISESGVTTKNGYFEPIFGDIQQPEGSDVPYNIIGAQFIPTEDHDARKTCTIFMEPQKGWVNRYFQGTDPVASDAGTSNMASSVWDKHYSTLAAVVDYRHVDIHYVYLQTLLLGLYYSEDGVHPIPELLEANIGMAYRNYKISKGKIFEKSLVLNTELPDAFRTASNLQIGIDTKEARKRLVVDKLYEIINAYGERMFLKIFYYQLKTFSCEITDSGKSSWGPIDRRYHKDDVLFSTAFSYICQLCFFNRICENRHQSAKKLTIVSALRYDKVYNLRRVNIKKRT